MSSTSPDIIGDGPIERIVISCVTFDTVKITDPIKYYDATKAYLLHYCEEDSNYEEYFERVLEILGEYFDTSVNVYGDNDSKKGKPDLNNSSKVQNAEDPDKRMVKKLIVEDVNEPVFNFQNMLKVLFNIMSEERSSDSKSKNPIYVNISAGTSEYSAAALIASMMFDNVIVFSVFTKEHTVDNKNQKLYYDENGKFIGLARAVKDPTPINNFSIPRPDRNVVLSLRLYSEEEFPSATRMIEALKDKGLWGKPDGNLPNEKMRFQRQFIDRWLNEGLIEKKRRGEYLLTASGKFAVDTYYVNE